MFCMWMICPSRSALLPMGLFTIGPAPRLSLAQGSLL